METDRIKSQLKPDRQLTDAELQDLYAWIDKIPLSRPKRNITRDFSDAVATAEVVKHFIPRLVELHNYPPANAVAQKLYNWNTLNQKVFRKLGYSVCEDVISYIISNRPGVVEVVLFELRQKIESYLYGKDASKSQCTIPTSLPQPLAINNQQYVDKWLSESSQKIPKHTTTLPSQINTSPSPSAHQQRGPSVAPPAGFRGPDNVVTTMGPAQQNQTDCERLGGRVDGYINGELSFAAGVGQVSTETTLLTTALLTTTPSDWAQMIRQKEEIIAELHETVQILQLKVTKLEQLLGLKDRRIEDLINQLQSAGVPFS
ncbi:Sperm flagellar protein 1 [Quaeritorhiza haematococci]|nr:Sperm flagellar protein 1 [Quaeritorhiza haematococci]